MILQNSDPDPMERRLYRELSYYPYSKDGGFAIYVPVKGPSDYPMELEMLTPLSVDFDMAIVVDKREKTITTGHYPLTAPVLDLLSDWLKSIKEGSFTI